MYMHISSKKYFALSSSKNILNLGMSTEFLNVITRSTPISFETAASTAIVQSLRRAYGISIR